MAARQLYARTLHVSGSDLVIREWRSEGDAALVYWPGLNPFGALDLIEAGPTWSARYGFHVVAISAPGCGESQPLRDPDAYRPFRLAELVLHMLDTLGLESVAFVGFSWGGAVGAHLTVAAPERIKALVLLDSGYNDPRSDPTYQPRPLDEMAAEFREQHRRFRFPTWAAFVSSVSDRADWRPALELRYRAGMQEVEGEIVPRSDPDSAAAASRGIDAEPVGEILGKLASALVSILVLASGRIVFEEDWARRALDRFCSALPAADLEIVEGAGHDILFDAPRSIDIIGKWLSG